MLDPRLNSSWWVLRLAYGVVPIVAGLDKFTNLMTRWTDYLSPLAVRTLPVSAPTFMHLVGVVEICAGVLVLTRFTRLAAWIVAAWLLLIALNLLTTGRFFDIAARDVVLALGAFVLAQLTLVKEAAGAAAAAQPGLATARHPA